MSLSLPAKLHMCNFPLTHVKSAQDFAPGTASKRQSPYIQNRIRAGGFLLLQRNQRFLRSKRSLKTHCAFGDLSVSSIPAALAFFTGQNLQRLHLPYPHPCKHLPPNLPRHKIHRQPHQPSLRLQQLSHRFRPSKSRIHPVRQC